MGSTKVISSCFVVIFTLIAILMEHSASATTKCECDNTESTMAYLKTVEELVEKLKENILSDKHDDCEVKPMDCAEVLQSGDDKSGVYTIWPKNKIIDRGVEVYCDMETDGGGWTVIQRRGDYGNPKDYFYKDWESYKKGFGDVKEDFWLGNDLIFALTNQTRCSIRFDITDLRGTTAYANYDNFWIEDEEEQYRLHISDYNGTAGDNMINVHDNMKFSTKDRNNDQGSSNCAEMHKGAWWYNNCADSNLNGLYLKTEAHSSGVSWYYWKNTFEPLAATEMKIRPKSFHKE